MTEERYKIEVAYWKQKAKLESYIEALEFSYNIVVSENNELQQEVEKLHKNIRR